MLERSTRLERSTGLVGIMTLTIILLLSARCSRNAATGEAGNNDVTMDRIADRPIVAETLTAIITGSIRKLPEMGIFEIAPVGDEIQSTYGRTTDMNREFRRGIFEFQIPKDYQALQYAQLIIVESRATSSYPMPPDAHTLSYYNADTLLTLEDYNRRASKFLPIVTDVNDSTKVFVFNVTGLVREYAGKSLGFRVKLDVDSIYGGIGFLGSGFLGTSCSSPNIIVQRAPFADER